MDYLLLVLVFIAGISLAITLTYFFISRTLSKTKQQLAISTSDNQRHKLENEKLESKINKLSQDLSETQMHLAAVNAENSNLIKNNEAKEKEIAELHNRLTKEFEDIANRVLVVNSKEINEQNHKKLSDILTPLKEKINFFEKKVDDAYEKEMRDKVNLKAEVKKLFELNQRISEEAENLTKALKGDVKKIGNWGEMILERVLEQSGLTKNREYQREVVDKNAEGEIIRPDVIINLPENKHLIIDSKFSLIAYDEFINTEDENKRNIALKKHKESLRNHIKSLYEKNYSSAKNLNCPDFVLMFIPIEASFAISVESDNELFAFAWERKIVPVSPSTLLASLKTIGSIWKQENQTKNAQEIARQSGALYDKFVGFINDMEKIGSNINALNNSYESAFSKLQTGKGNLISKAEKIKKLGAKNNKSIPEQLINNED